ncbi:MAG: alanine racemase [Acidimicrobiales bacterium]
MPSVLEEAALPVLVLKKSALDNNLEVMARYAGGHGFVLAPHGKTTMAPALFRRQLEAGAWGITVANMSQALVAYGAGATRVVVANEVVGPVDARAMAEALAPGGRELYCLADSVEGVSFLDRNLAATGVRGRLRVLVEVGAPGSRAGVRSEEEGLGVARAVRDSPHLRLAGVEGFEGALASDRSPGALAKVDGYLEGLRRFSLRLAGTGALDGPGPAIVSAGGSKYFDRVARVLGPGAAWGQARVLLVVRAGCYLLHDHGIYAGTSPLAGGGAGGAGLVPAMEVWAEVLSTPEPGLAIVGLGKRDASYDLGLPVPLHVVRGGTGPVEPLTEDALVRLDDQHGYLQPGRGLRVGDRVGFGLSHPCTVFDKWRSALVVDDDYRVLERVETFFH